MRLQLPGLRTVLVRDPGPDAPVTIHALLDEGARVDVAASRPDPALTDLAARGLITLVADPDPNGYDLVLRDPGRAAPVPTEPVLGQVILVGGGPGDPGLLTVAGLAAIRAADVIVTDRLAPLASLAAARPDAQIVHVGKIPRGAFTPQEAINSMLVEHARAGRTVVRLKGGDSFVFGRGGEEWNYCVAQGIPVSVIPGVSSSTAVAGLAGIPLTHRGLTQGFVVATGHVAPDDPRGDVEWERLATLGMSIVVMMGVAALPQIVRRLTEAGMDPSTPAACIADGGMPSMRVARARLSTIVEEAHRVGIGAPAITVIGAVVEALRPAPGDHEPSAAPVRMQAKHTLSEEYS